VFYCSPECQRRAWSEHKPKCFRFVLEDALSEQDLKRLYKLRDRIFRKGGAEHATMDLLIERLALTATKEVSMLLFMGPENIETLLDALTQSKKGNTARMVHEVAELLHSRRDMTLAQLRKLAPPEALSLVPKADRVSLIGLRFPSGSIVLGCRQYKTKTKTRTRLSVPSACK
jgi:hypothetical protein